MDVAREEVLVVVERVDDRVEFLVMDVPVVLVGLEFVMKHHDRTELTIGTRLGYDTTIGDVRGISFQGYRCVWVKTREEDLLL